MKFRSIAKRFRNRLLQLGFFKPNPIVLNIFTTNRCNFSCFYCSRNVKNESKSVENRYAYQSEFHIDDLRLLLHKYKSIRYVSFAGIGEPFLAKDLIPMAELAKKHKKRVGVITNGSLLHNHWGDICRFFDEISISLHGLTADELKVISKVDKQVFNQVIENVHYLLHDEKKLNPALAIRASIVILKQNLEQVKRAARFCAENGIPQLDLQNYLPYSLEDFENCIFDDELNCISFLNDIAKEFDDVVKINLPILIKRDVNTLSWGCVSFFNTLRVDGLGQVSGCNRVVVPKAENGNFRDETAIWWNTYFTDMRTRFKLKKDLPICCRYCPDAQ